MGLNLSDILRAEVLNDINAYRKIESFPFEQRNKISKLQRKILGYKIPVYKISDVKTYEEIADVFVRLNSGGVKVKGFEIFFSFVLFKNTTLKGY